MWEAVAEYADGTTIRRLFNYNENENEDEQQYHIEEWLLNRHPDCTYYSVNWVDDELIIM